MQLSQHKFASNVVEKCLQYGQPEGRQVYGHFACMFCNAVINLVPAMQTDRLCFVCRKPPVLPTVMLVFTFSLLQPPAVTQYPDSYFLPRHAGSEHVYISNAHPCACVDSDTGAAE